MVEGFRKLLIIQQLLSVFISLHDFILSEKILRKLLKL